MSISTLSFVAWALAMVVILIGMVVSLKRSKRFMDRVEKIASQALPEIGTIAEKKHRERFGSLAPRPGPNGSWYPKEKKLFAKKSVV